MDEAKRCGCQRICEKRREKNERKKRFCFVNTKQVLPKHALNKGLHGCYCSLMSALLRSKNAAYVQIVKEHQKRVLDYNIDDEYCTMAPRLEHELSIVEDALGSSSSSSSSSSLRLRTQHSYLSSEVTGSKLIIAPDSLFEHDGEWQTRRRRKGSPKAKNWWKFNPLSRFLKSSRKLINLPPTTSLPILVLIDMFAVSLMVPLLFQYYKAAGITSANQRELLSSLFSTAQIVGGLLMGVLSDAKLLQRRTILFLSFGGSAVSYALIVYGGIYTLTSLTINVTFLGTF